MRSNNEGNVNTTGTSALSVSRIVRTIRRFLHEIPLLVIVLMVINITIYILVWMHPIDYSSFSTAPRKIYHYHEYYRMISYAFLHISIWHIASNVLCLFLAGFFLERDYGSFKFLYITWLSLLLIAFFYIVLSLGAAWITNDWIYIHRGSVGYSGIIFTYMVIVCFHAPDPYYPFLGLITIPTKLDPFLNLVLVQILIPQASFICHVSGLIVGIILMTPIGYQLFFPSEAALEWLEGLLVPAVVKTMTAYRPMTTKELIHPCFHVSLSYRYVQSCQDQLRVFGHQFYETCCSCFASNPIARSQGYEAVPTSSDHDADIANGEGGDVEMRSNLLSPSSNSSSPFMTNNMKSTAQPLPSGQGNRPLSPAGVVYNV